MEQPPSPATSPGELGQCIHRILKFILQSRVDRSLDVGLCLSADYCCSLLREDPLTATATPDSAPPAPSVSAGVPEYPLYKRLALALQEAILSGGIPERSDGCSCSNLAFSSQGDGESLKQVFDELISRYGAELLDIMKSVRFGIHVQEPYFSQLRDGKKTVEGRCAVGDYNCIKSEDFILFNNCLVFQVQCIHHYASFYEMLEGENLEKVLPGILSIEEGIQVYRKFYSEEKERSNGVLGIGVSKSSAQPYICLARILSGLSYKGIQQLLGFVHTVGTVSESLPPPSSVLLSAFQQLYNPVVKGCILTEGARALAKHIYRSSDKYWGDFKGSESSKNKSATDVILSLMSTCCWRNLHVVPPHGCVLELRDSNGFGARWSSDGAKVMLCFCSILDFWSRIWSMVTRQRLEATKTATIQIPGNIVFPSGDLKSLPNMAIQA